MDQQSIHESIDRYLREEMDASERGQFEQMRKQSPELDQMVVEHMYFLEQMDFYASRKRFKYGLHDVHNTLMESGEIKPAKPLPNTGFLFNLRRYKRVVAVAASIAGATALLISGLTAAFTPKAPIRDIEELRRKVTKLERQTSNQGEQINAVKNKIDPSTPVKFGGTGFLLDAKGYLVTSAHVVADAGRIFVQNNAGQDFLAETVIMDKEKDIAILRINDADFKPLPMLPYSVGRAGIEIAEPVFTLGYPKDEIVYGEGYLSAQSGLKGDTMTYQMSISANPGNSGGPVINRKGEVIGILNARQTEAEGVVFAVKSVNIHRLVDELKRQKPEETIRIPMASGIRGLDRVQQVRRIQGCVYMVKIVV